MDFTLTPNAEDSRSDTAEVADVDFPSSSGRSSLASSNAVPLSFGRSSSLAANGPLTLDGSGSRRQAPSRASGGNAVLESRLGSLEGAILSLQDALGRALERSGPYGDHLMRSGLDDVAPLDASSNSSRASVSLDSSPP